jgi:hypothetical protein
MPVKKKWIRRGLLILATATVAIVVVLIVLWSLMRAAPEFYKPVVLTLEQRQAAAQRAENKFTDIQNRAARLRAEERAAQLNRDTTSTQRAGEAITISFTADELTAFFEKWSVFQDWKRSYEKSDSTS